MSERGREWVSEGAMQRARNGCLSHYSPLLYELSHRRTQKRNSLLLNKGERFKREELLTMAL